MELPESLSSVYTVGPRIYKSLGSNVHILTMKDPQQSNKRAVLKIARSKIDTTLPVHNEARLLSNLRHSNLITMICWDKEDGEDFMVLEKMTGSLHGYQLFKGGFFEADEAYLYLKQMASVLDYLHSVELIHRDLKSENILVDLVHDWNGSPLLKLCDFSSSLYSHEIDNDKQLRGTLDFVSPEAVKEEKITTAVDVWGLGATYYDWIVGKPPFQRDGYLETYQAIVNDHPDYSLCNKEQIFLLGQMLEKDPKKRITAPLLNLMINECENDHFDSKILMEITGGDKIETRKLINTFDWYTREQQYETHKFESMDDIWRICHLDDCEQEDFELTKEGWVSFRSDEWIKFPEGSGHLNEQFLEYCKRNFTLTSGHHWSKNGKIVVIIHSTYLEFKIKGETLILTPQEYMKYLITFFGCLIYKPDPRLIDTFLGKNGKRCNIEETKEILSKVYAMEVPFNYELVYDCKESVIEKMIEYKPIKPETIKDLLGVIGYGIEYRDDEMGNFVYHEYPDSVIFESKPFDRELYEHFGLTMDEENNKFLVYYVR